MKLTTLQIQIAALLLSGVVMAQDAPKFTREPISVENLARLLGIEKSGFQVKLPEKKHVRLVAEITVKGKTRKEFITLMSAAQEFTVAVFTVSKPSTFTFQRLSIEMNSVGGAESRQSIYDFDGAMLNGTRTSLDNGTVTFDYRFQTNPNGPGDKIEEVGSVKIYLETSSKPFTEKQ